MQKDDRYAWLRGLAVEAVTGAVRTYIPGSNTVLDNPTVKSAVNEVAKITQEQASQIRTKLHDKLGNQISDYLNPSLRLGLALGRDLYEFSKNFPLLIFFDTYEEVDEGERLLRIVMHAAGMRVGWIIAGRDDLYAGWSQRERSIAMEYGYKDLVLFDRCLSVDFNAGGVGAFTPGDILSYFTQVCEKVQYSPPLAMIKERDAARIYDVTQGVPLAVKLAAGLYVETTNLKIVLDDIDKKQNIVDQMVQRYLIHARSDQGERSKLYGLALLRRSDQPPAIAAALDLTTEKAATSYAKELSRLHRRYSFIFSEKDRPSLHQEVRYFLRLWLFKRYMQPEIIVVNERLKKHHLSSLQNLESSRQYKSLKERFEDEQWIGVYLDLTEQMFWLDPFEGVEYALPFILAASIYRREICREAIEIGRFFEHALVQPYRKTWEWSAQSLIYKTSHNPSHEELVGLEELEKLTQERCPAFLSSLLRGNTYQEEIKAALWWRLGEAHEGSNDYTALEYYKKALNQLKQNTELHNAAARTALNAAYKLFNKKKYLECIPWIDKSLEIQPDSIAAFFSLGVVHLNLKEYQKALADFNRAIELAPDDAGFYNNRGATYRDLREYQKALADHNHAIELAPNEVYFYISRGVTHRDFNMFDEALFDLNHAITSDRHSALVFGNRGEVYSKMEEYEKALTDLNLAIQLDKATASTWYNSKGLVFSYLGRYEEA
jgi:tetratricopeptide (TPR) repeat protein